MKNIKNLDYPFTMRHLSQEDGGGYLIEFPDLPGCMSDGETIVEAIENGKEAIQAWLETAKEMNRAIPEPGELEAQSGKWVQRVPKSIHMRLVEKAKEEGVSLNTLVITMLSETLGTYGYRSFNSSKLSGIKLSEKKTEYKLDKSSRKKSFAAKRHSSKEIKSKK